MEEFKLLSKCELKKMSQEERIEYQKKAKEYLGNLSNQLKNIEKKALIHPLLLSMLSLYPKRIIKLNNIQYPNDGGPVIFSANHSNSNDFPMIAKLVKKHFFILADYTMQNDFFVDLLNKLNGCIYVDRESKQSGINATNQAIEGIKNGHNMVIFPESTWNLLPNQPILPRKWGDLKIASETKRPILPIVLEYNGFNCFAKFGNLMYADEHSDLQQLDNHLYEEMTQLKKDIRQSDVFNKNYKHIDYDEWLRKTIMSYKNFDVEYEMSFIRKIDDSFDEALEHIINVGEEIHPKEEIEKRLQFSKVNYRLK